MVPPPPFTEELSNYGGGREGDPLPRASEPGGHGLAAANDLPSSTAANASTLTPI